MQKDEVEDTVILEMSKKDFEYLKRCFVGFQDMLEMNRIFDESCARIKKKERRELERFTNKFILWGKGGQF